MNRLIMLNIEWVHGNLCIVGLPPAWFPFFLNRFWVFARAPGTMEHSVECLVARGWGDLNDVLNSSSSSQTLARSVHGNLLNHWVFYWGGKLISCFINGLLPKALVNFYYTRKWINWMFLLGIPARLILVPRQVRLHNGQHRDTASSAAEYNYRKWYFSDIQKLIRDKDATEICSLRTTGMRNHRVKKDHKAKLSNLNQWSNICLVN